jgi:hypothetical protein
VIAVIDPYVSLAHLAQALACAGLEVTQTSEGAVISVSAAYRDWGYTATGHVPALIRFQGVQHE